MRTLLLALAGLSFSGFGLTLATPAQAMTADQAAAESLEAPTSTSVPKTETASAAATNAQQTPSIIPGNGLAQARVVRVLQLGQQ